MHRLQHLWAIISFRCFQVTVGRLRWEKAKGRFPVRKTTSNRLGFGRCFLTLPLPTNFTHRAWWNSRSNHTLQVQARSNFSPLLKSWEWLGFPRCRFSVRGWQGFKVGWRLPTLDTFPLAHPTPANRRGLLIRVPIRPFRDTCTSCILALLRF